MTPEEYAEEYKSRINGEPTSLEKTVDSVAELARKITELEAEVERKNYLLNEWINAYHKLSTAFQKQTGRFFDESKD